MHVRLATAADSDRVLELMEDFNRLEAIPFARAPFARALAPLLDGSGHFGRVLVAELDGAAVGYALVTWGYDLEYGGRDAWLTELYLAPSARRQGHGRRLLDEAAATARGDGAHMLHLQVRSDNAEARTLYERAGFAAWKRLGYSKPL